MFGVSPGLTQSCGLICDTKKTPSKNFEGASGGRKRLTGIIPGLGHGGAKPENQSSID